MCVSPSSGFRLPPCWEFCCTSYLHRSGRFMHPGGVNSHRGGALLHLLGTLSHCGDKQTHRSGTLLHPFGVLSYRGGSSSHRRGVLTFLRGALPLPSGWKTLYTSVSVQKKNGKTRLPPGAAGFTLRFLRCGRRIGLGRRCLPVQFPQLFNNGCHTRHFHPFGHFGFHINKAGNFKCFGAGKLPGVVYSFDQLQQLVFDSREALEEGEVGKACF